MMTDQTAKISIFPVFLSGFRCAGRCVYCNAALSSGICEPTDCDSLERDIELWLNSWKTVERREIALYGNDLPCLPEDVIDRLMGLCSRFVETRRVSGIRTSLRPDSVLMQTDRFLSAFSVIELGVPSMDPRVLEADSAGSRSRNRQHRH